MNLLKKIKEKLRRNNEPAIDLQVLEVEVLVKDKNGNIKSRQNIIINK
jgi:hypothetical protein